uniref:E3 ubiquitin-protein ligase RNF10 isoform X2 n=1 Tax=Myxine glutinosa TaxID=7769 RepID=UPI00358F985F
MGEAADVADKRGGRCLQAAVKESKGKCGRSRGLSWANHHQQQQRSEIAMKPPSIPIHQSRGPPKGLDKRPKSRSTGPTLEPASSPVASSNRRPKMNANDLIRFTLSPREMGGWDDWGSRRRGNWSGGSESRASRTSCRKLHSLDAFVLANCQLVVEESEVNGPWRKDPDVMVPWEKVLYVLMWREGEPVCPICLDHPTAPRTARCGHVFCWPCCSHLLSISDTSGITLCPVCFQLLELDSLRSVVWRFSNPCVMGDSVTFGMVKRGLHSMRGKPQTAGGPGLGHVRVLGASFSEAAELLDAQRVELRSLLPAPDDEAPFILTSLAELQVQLDAWTAHSLGGLSLQSGTEKDLSEQKKLKELSGYDEMNDDEEDFYFYYQAENGQHIYLLPLTWRCMLSEYGTPTACPNRFSGSLISKEAFTMTQAMRKRFKYLDHIPLGCSFVFYELDLDSSVVSPETLQCFSKEMEKRRLSRVRKEKEEKRRERRIRLEETRVYGTSYTEYCPALGSYTHFPEIQSSNHPLPAPLDPSDFPASLTSSPPAATAASSPPAASAASSPPAASAASFPPVGTSFSSSPPVVTSTNQSPCFSFAQALSQGRNQNRSFVGQRKESEVDSDVESDQEHMNAPTYSDSFSLALSSTCPRLDPSADAHEEDNQNGQRGRRKKKRQKRLLFSSSISYGHLT